MRGFLPHCLKVQQKSVAVWKYFVLYCVFFFLYVDVPPPHWKSTLFFKKDYSAGYPLRIEQRTYTLRQARTLVFTQLCSTAKSRIFHRTPAGYTAKEKTRRKRNKGYQGLLSVARQPLPPLPLSPHTARLLHCLGCVIRTGWEEAPPPSPLSQWTKIGDFQEERLKRRTASN